MPKKKTVKKKVEKKIEPPKPRHFSQCECGSKETEQRNIPQWSMRAYCCLACNKSWEVPFRQIEQENGY
jgi:hypothetical protein